VEKAPEDLEARRRLGHVLSESGRLSEAIKQFEFVVWRDPKDRQAQARLQELRQRLSREGEGIRARLARVREALRAGRLGLARADAEGLVAAQPKDAEAFAVRGEVLLALGDPKSALADFERSLSLGGGKAALFGKAEAHMALGEKDAARSAYERLLASGRVEPWREMRARQVLRELAAKVH